MEKIINIDFSTSKKCPSSLKWLVGQKPRKYVVKDNNLCVEPHFETDFWRNTYYDPPLRAYNGHVLGITTTEDMFVIETQFSFHPSKKFDQAGVFMGSQESDWVKAGVEHVDGKTWQSVVVTRNDNSDWSKAKLPWPESTDVYIRMYRQGESGVVEVSEDGKNYEFVRIFHLPMNGEVSAGVMVCRPKKENEEVAGNEDEHCVQFKYIKISKHSGYHHHA